MPERDLDSSQKIEARVKKTRSLKNGKCFFEKVAVDRGKQMTFRSIGQRKLVYGEHFVTD